MKLMKIFGMVFALHVALACVVVLIQGCSSTSNPPASNEVIPIASTPASAPTSENWTSDAAAQADLAAANDPYYPPVTPVTGETLSGPSPAERARAEPTRPTNPGDFIDVDLPSAGTPPPAEPVTYVVRSGDSFWRIARANDIPVGELQRLNPGVKADSLRPGMVIKLPGTAPAATTSAAPTFGSGVTSAASTSTYIVRAGDSLSRIAARNGTTVAALRGANNLRSDVLQIGQELLIPGGGVTQGPAASSAIAPLQPPGESGDQVTFVVQRGDTLGEIAQKFDVTVSDLMAANNITDPRRVRAGQELVIPGFQAVGSGAIPRSPPAQDPAPRPSTPAERALLPPPGSTPAPETPPADERPPELDAPPDEIDAPPVQPLDDPMPAP